MAGGGGVGIRCVHGNPSPGLDADRGLDLDPDPDRDRADRDPDPTATATPTATPTSTPTPTPPRPGAFANVDLADDGVVGPPDAIDDCEGALKRAGVKFQTAALPIKQKGKLTCGAPQVVVYQKGPGNIAYNPAPLLTCRMALALAFFDGLVQEEAQKTLGSPIVRIDQIGTYNCREMAAYKGFVSEHSYANAIDLARFVLKNGKSIEVERDFDKSAGAPAKPFGVFLRAISRRAHDEDVFSNMLTPFWDALHKNHFHLDLARYRVDGTR